MLVMGFTSEVGDGIHPKDVSDLNSDLNLAIVGRILEKAKIAYACEKIEPGTRRNRVPS